MLKGLIVLLMIALVVTLGAGLYFLMIDQGDVKNTRLANSLRVRGGIAGTLMALIADGVATGQVGHQSPSDARTPSAGAGSKKPGDTRPYSDLAHLSNDVNKDKEKHPHHINKVPVPARR